MIQGVILPPDLKFATFESILRLLGPLFWVFPKSENFKMAAKSGAFLKNVCRKVLQM